MELLEQWAVRTRDPGNVVRTLRATESVLAGIAVEEYRRDRARERGRDLDRRRVRREPLPRSWLDAPGIAGFYGVGLWLPDRYETPLPALFVDTSLDSSEEGRPLRRSSEVGGRIRELNLPVAFSDLDVWVVGRTRPRMQHCSPGEAVTVAAKTGTLGCRVRFPRGERGITTAGHTGSRGARAVVDGYRIGRIAQSIDPRREAPGTASADVAVIKLDRRHEDALSRPFFSYHCPRQGEDLVVNVRSGPQEVWARAVRSTILLDRSHAAWGNVLETDRLVSESGDSGSTVEPADSPGALVGHVVAGDAVRTLVQDLDYQLHALELRLR
ncbi:hypothetical protein ACWEVP_38150 [Amycolatopsis sp. NPDC003865]